MKLFVNVYNDARLLPHFLDHYAARGVTEFFVAVTPEFAADAVRLSGGYRVTLNSELDVADSGLQGSAAISAMRLHHEHSDEWVVICDLDEFVEGADLRTVARAAERAGANVVRGVMHDRFSVDGQPHGPSEQEVLAEYPIKSRFIRDVMRGCDHKGILVRGHLRPAQGAAHHRFEDELAFSKALEISHYKWTSGSVERLRRNYALAKRRGVAWADEYRRALEHYDTHGCFAWWLFGGRHSHDFVPEPPDQCSVCHGVIWEAERRYSLSRYGLALCRTHQREMADRAQPIVE